MLRLNGIDAEPVTISAKAKTAGEAMLSFAEGLNSDLLIKGAYTQSRLRQMIFGGATSHILASARMPVFMAH
jgi:nucleotide-binding universal stress UspA family protein